MKFSLTKLLVVALISDIIVSLVTCNLKHRTAYSAGYGDALDTVAKIMDRTIRSRKEGKNGDPDTATMSRIFINDTAVFDLSPRETKRK